MFRLAIVLVMSGLFCEAYRFTDLFSDEEPGPTCEGAEYNPDTHLCCEGKLRKIFNKRKACCGDGTYNPNTHVCCGSTKYATSRYGASECCGDRSYNPKFAECCSDNSINRKGSCPK